MTEAPSIDALRNRVQHQSDRDEIAWRVPYPRQTELNILSYLASGFLPWGLDMRRWGAADISKHGRKWIMCCGHTLTLKRAQVFVDAGLLMPGPPDARKDGKPTLVITPAGKEYLQLWWPPCVYRTRAYKQRHRKGAAA